MKMGKNMDANASNVVIFYAPSLMLVALRHVDHAHGQAAPFRRHMGADMVSPSLAPSLLVAPPFVRKNLSFPSPFEGRFDSRVNVKIPNNDKVCQIRQAGVTPGQPRRNRFDFNKL